MDSEKPWPFLEKNVIFDQCVCLLRSKWRGPRLLCILAPGPWETPSGAPTSSEHVRGTGQGDGWKVRVSLDEGSPRNRYSGCDLN